MNGLCNSFKIKVFKFPEVYIKVLAVLKRFKFAQKQIINLLGVNTILMV